MAELGRSKKNGTQLQPLLSSPITPSAIASGAEND